MHSWHFAKKQSCEKERHSRKLTQVLRHTAEVKGCKIDLASWMLASELSLAAHVPLAKLWHVIDSDTSRFESSQGYVRAKHGHSMEKIRNYLALGRMQLKHMSEVDITLNGGRNVRSRSPPRTMRRACADPDVQECTCPVCLTNAAREQLYCWNQ